MCVNTGKKTAVQASRPSIHSSIPEVGKLWPKGQVCAVHELRMASLWLEKKIKRKIIFCDTCKLHAA